MWAWTIFNLVSSSPRNWEVCAPGIRAICTWGLWAPKNLPSTIRVACMQLLFWSSNKQTEAGLRACISKEKYIIEIILLVVLNKSWVATSSPPLKLTPVVYMILLLLCCLETFEQGQITVPGNNKEDEKEPSKLSHNTDIPIVREMPALFAFLDLFLIFFYHVIFKCSFWTFSVYLLLLLPSLWMIGFDRLQRTENDYKIINFFFVSILPY